MVIAVWDVNPNDRKCQPHLRYVHLMFFMIDGVAFITVLYKFLVAMFFFLLRKSFYWLGYSDDAVKFVKGYRSYLEYTVLY